MTSKVWDKAVRELGLIPVVDANMLPQLLSCAARNRDHPATSGKTRILKLGSRQIDHRTTVYMVGDQEGD
jgi:hypothetical protein